MAGEPSPSGVNDALLGGHANMGPDRDAARAIEARYPAVPEMIRAGHAFTLRTARWGAELGIRRFIRAGFISTMPGRNTHDAVRSVAAGCRVVYITRGDQAAIAMAQFAGGRDVTVARARVADPQQVLAAPPVAAMIAEGEPVCLVTGMYYHNASAEWCGIHMAAYSAALPPGSVLAASLMAIPGEEDAAKLGALFGMTLYAQTAEDVAGWAGGMEVIPLTPEITVPGTALGVAGQIP